MFHKIKASVWNLVLLLHWGYVCSRVFSNTLFHFLYSKQQTLVSVESFWTHFRQAIESSRISSCETPHSTEWKRIRRWQDVAIEMDSKVEVPTNWFLLTNIHDIANVKLDHCRAWCRIEKAHYWLNYRCCMSIDGIQIIVMIAIWNTFQSRRSSGIWTMPPPLLEE